MLKNLVVLMLMSFSLVACERTMFGMPESQFRSLAPAQQQQVISAYNQRQMVKAQNEPLTSAIGILGMAVGGRRD